MVRWECSICLTKYTVKEWVENHYDDICDKCVSQAKDDGIIKD